MIERWLVTVAIHQYVIQSIKAQGAYRSRRFCFTLLQWKAS